MKKYCYIFISTSIIAVLAFISLTVLTVYRVPAPDVPEEVIFGKRVWQQNSCVECHTLFGDGGYNARDLTRETTRRDARWLKNYFRDRPVMKPSRFKRHPGLNGEDADYLIKYLQFVNRVEIYNWPPKPLK